MNVRESGARSARRFTTALGMIGAAVASIIGISVWAGTTASAATNTSSSTSTTRGDDDGNEHSFGTSPGVVSPGQGGQSHANSNGS